MGYFNTKPAPLLEYIYEPDICQNCGLRLPLENEERLNCEIFDFYCEYAQFLCGYAKFIKAVEGGMK